MRILVLTNYDVGLYQFRKELIEQLLMDNEVYISLPYGKLVEPLVDTGCAFIEISFERRSMNPVRDIKLYKQYKSVLNQVNPDLVITYTIKPNIYGGLACKLKAIPYAVNITGLGTAFQKNGILRHLVIRLYRSALKKAKVVFFENCENRQAFIDYKIIAADKTCLLNGAGVNLDKFTLTEYPSDIGETRFLFMGRVMKEKGIDELFDTMHRLYTEGYDCTLAVLGNYEEDYRETIEKYSEEGWLDYQGYQEDVRPFIERCHCFVLPSWHEGMANTNLECAAMGRPVITSNIHGCMEAVEDGVSGFLCEKQNPDDLYEKMKKFISLTYEERRAMGIAGRKRMEEIFDKRKVVEETIKRLY